MVTPEQNVYGVSFPGVPQIIIGFNEHIAWGQTNVGMDVSDLYEIAWADEHHRSYYLDDQVREIDFRIEQYEVRNAATVIDTIKYTNWGPVMVEDSQSSLALHWLPNVDIEGCAFTTFYMLNKSKNFEEYYQALRHFHSPPQNFVFASREGDIAMKVQGKLPIKKVNQGRFIQDGSKSSNGWKGYIPHQETPIMKNPERGFVSSANQHSTDTTYPYYYHGYFEDYRSRSLNDQLSALQKIEISDMRRLQNNSFSRFAADLCPLLLDLVSAEVGQQNKQLFQLLSDWDYQYDRDAEAPIYFEYWHQKFYRLAWDEFYGHKTDQLFPETWRTIALVAEAPEHRFFDILSTPEIESAQDLAILTFNETISYFDSLTSKSRELSWQDHRQLNISHLSRIPAFSARNVKTGGTSTALNAVSSRNAPSWRMIVDMGEKIDAWGVYPGGASGNPGSRYYKTGIDTWAEGEYFKLHFFSVAGELPDSLLLYKESFQP